MRDPPELEEAVYPFNCKLNSSSRLSRSSKRLPRPRLWPVVVAATLVAAGACVEEPSATAPELAPAATALPPGGTFQSGDHFVPERVLVRFHPGADGAGIARAHGAAFERDVTLGIVALRVPRGSEVALAQVLSRNPNVEFAEPDWIRLFGDPACPGCVPSDPFLGYKWDLHNDGHVYTSGGTIVANTGAVDADIDWLEAYQQLGPGFSGAARVGVLDTGIWGSHPDLAGKVAAEWDFFDGDSNAMDDHGHGTHVAGIAAGTGNNGTGITGVAYPASIRLVIGKVCGPIIGSYYGCPSSGTASAITWAVNNGADVINLSLGGSSPSSAEQSALQYARANDVLPFCAAGNNSGAVSYPAAFPECVAVSATDWGDGLASYSNYGPQVELAAPGGDSENSSGYSYILSSCYDPDSPSTQYCFMIGTSMATPQATGLGGLLFAVMGAGTTDDDVLERLTSTADDLGAGGKDNLFGYGRINALAAVNGGGPPPPNQPPTASFTFDCADLFCEFDASGSNDPDGTIVSYEWDFGDGNTASGVTASHTYAAANTYTVTLTVTDDDGAPGTDDQQVTVSVTPNLPPTASFTFDCADLACDFDASGSNDPDGTIVSYEWDFGDGSTATGVTASHTYAAANTYTVTLTVTDDDGDEGTDDQQVTVSEPAPGPTMHVSDIDASTRVKRNGWSVTLTVKIVDEDGRPVSSASVYGDWFGARTGSVSATTDRKGVAKFNSGNLPGGESSVTFTVSDVQHSSFTYDAGQNADPDGDSDGTAITVTK